MLRGWAALGEANVVKVLVVEDHPVVRAGLAAFIVRGLSPDTEIREASCGRQALALLGHDTDVAIVSVSLPDSSGLELTRQMKSLNPSTNVLIFSMTDAPLLAHRCMEAGAKGYFCRTDDPASLARAVGQIASGGTWLPDEAAQRLALVRIGCERASEISDRELKVLRQLVRGRSFAEIAGELDVSYKTVSNDTNALRAKLNARTSMELVRIAIEQKIV